jgi:hypothetical protein
LKPGIDIFFEKILLYSDPKPLNMENATSSISGIIMLEQLLAYFCFAAGVFILAYWRFKLSSIKSFKDKYDFISEHETKLLWYASIAFLAGIVFEIVILFPVEGRNQVMMHFAQLFTALMFGVIVGYIIFKYLYTYYPSTLNDRLHKLRYKPRISPKTGKPMKLLSEEEEDVHLSEGMQAEEEVFSIDYDVWVDEESGYVQIEKYRGNSEALECPSCGFETLRDVREEIIESHTVTT